MVVRQGGSKGPAVGAVECGCNPADVGDVFPTFPATLSTLRPSAGEPASRVPARSSNSQGWALATLAIRGALTEEVSFRP